MNLLSRLKRGATLVLGMALTIVLFPVFLATATFVLMTGFAGAVYGAHKIRQLAKQRDEAGKMSNFAADTQHGPTIEGNYYVVYPGR